MRTPNVNGERFLTEVMPSGWIWISFALFTRKYIMMWELDPYAHKEHMLVISTKGHISFKSCLSAWISGHPNYMCIPAFATNTQTYLSLYANITCKLVHAQFFDRWWAKQWKGSQEMKKERAIMGCAVLLFSPMGVPLSWKPHWGIEGPAIFSSSTWEESTGNSENYRKLVRRNHLKCYRNCSPPKSTRVNEKECRAME